MDEQTDFRVGLIVPSSNVTMEIEIPALLQRADAKYSFHSSRMRMRQVSAEELAAMDAQGVRCVQELVDARCDVMAYACLVAVMVPATRRASPGRKTTARSIHRGRIVRAGDLDVQGLSWPPCTSSGRHGSPW